MINPCYVGTLMVINLSFSIFMLIADQDTMFKIENFAGIATLAIFINCVFLADMVFSFVVLGCKNALKAKITLCLELLIQLASFWYIILLFSHKDFTKFGEFTELALVFCLRNLRLLGFMSEVENMKLIFETTRNITKPILGKFLFIYLVFYVYAQVGMLLFGGSLTDTTWRSLST